MDWRGGRGLHVPKPDLWICHRFAYARMLCTLEEGNTKVARDGARCEKAIGRSWDRGEGAGLGKGEMRPHAATRIQSTVSRRVIRQPKHQLSPSASLPACQD